MVFFCNLDIIVPPSDVKLAEQDLILKIVIYLRYEGQWDDIHNRMLVEDPIVDDGAQLSVFLGYVEGGRAVWPFSWSKVSFLQSFVNIFVLDLGFF